MADPQLSARCEQLLKRRDSFVPHVRTATVDVGEEVRRSGEFGPVVKRGVGWETARVKIRMTFRACWTHCPVGAGVIRISKDCAQPILV